nr:hypothetical protein 36 [Balneolaceae bacterium]
MTEKETTKFTCQKCGYEFVDEMPWFGGRNRFCQKQGCSGNAVPERDDLMPQGIRPKTNEDTE